MSNKQTKKNILIVDDDIKSALFVRNILQTSNEYATDVVHDGKEGYEKLYSRKDLPNQYNLLILELLAPTINGAEICQKMLKDIELKSVPVVLTSLLPLESKEFQQSLKYFPELSMVKGILQKPCEDKDVIHIVRDVIDSISR